MLDRAKRLLSFIARRWPQLLLGMLVVTIILGAIARILAPPEVVVETPRLRITEPLAGVVEVTFTGDRGLPSRLQLFRGSTFLPGSELAENLAPRLGLSRNAQVPGLYTNPDVTVTLSQPSRFDIAEYSNNEVYSKETVTVQQAQELALAFLGQSGYPIGELKLREDRTVFYVVSNDEDFVTTDPAKAEVVSLSYFRALGEYPTAINSTPTNTLTLLVTKRGVLNASFISLFFTAEPAQTVQLLSFDELLNQVQDGNYLILGTIDIIDPTDPNNALVSLRLTSKEVEYRFDPTQELFLPFVQFAGTATLKNNETLPIVITTPAVKTTPEL